MFSIGYTKTDPVQYFVITYCAAGTPAVKNDQLLSKTLEPIFNTECCQKVNRSAAQTNKYQTAVSMKIFTAWRRASFRFYQHFAHFAAVKCCFWLKAAAVLQYLVHARVKRLSKPSCYSTSQQTLIVSRKLHKTLRLWHYRAFCCFYVLNGFMLLGNSSDPSWFHVCFLGLLEEDRQANTQPPHILNDK